MLGLGAKHSGIKSLFLTRQYLPECFAPTDALWLTNQKMQRRDRVYR
jgi:hypothetical protein